MAGARFDPESPLGVGADGSVEFNYNLLNLQTKGLPAVEYEKKLIRSADKSVLYGAVVTIIGASPWPSNSGSRNSRPWPVSTARFLTEDSSPKLQLVDRIKEHVAGLEFPLRRSAAIERGSSIPCRVTWGRPPSATAGGQAGVDGAAWGCGRQWTRSQPDVERGSGPGG